MGFPESPHPPGELLLALWRIRFPMDRKAAFCHSFFCHKIRFRGPIRWTSLYAPHRITFQIPATSAKPSFLSIQMLPDSRSQLWMMNLKGLAAADVFRPGFSAHSPLSL